MNAENLIHGLQVTGLGMLIVFTTLYILSLVMTAMRPIFYREPKKQTAMPESTPAPEAPPEPEPVSGLSPQTVAVIATAVAAYLGSSPGNFNIINISRVPSHMSNWGMASRQESLRK